MNEWPNFSRKEVIVGNPEANIGICTLWTPREFFVKKYAKGAMDKIAIVGNLYSVLGIGILIRNYLANPNLRFLIVTGNNQGLSKLALKNMVKWNGMHIKDLSLKKEHVERFLEQVNMIFLDDKKEVVHKIQDGKFEINDNKKFKKIIVKLPKPKATSFPSAQSGYLIRVRTVEEGYRKLLGEIRRFGHITGQDSEGQRRQELWELNMVITSQDPCDFSSIPHPEYTPSQIKSYCQDFWLGKEPKDLAYRYGYILRFVYGDQVEAVKNAFKDKAETFRTVMSLWDPKNSIKEKDPPCIVLIHPRIIGNFLLLWAYIRTNDMFAGWPLNAAALRYFQYRLLEELKRKLKRPELQLGELGVTSGSAHIYERTWLAVDSFLREEKPEKFHPDPKGNFEIKIENGMIKINHYSPEGEQLLQVFTGTTARELSRKIEPFISQTSNALYLGRELQKAEMEVKNGHKRNC